MYKRLDIGKMLILILGLMLARTLISAVNFKDLLVVLPGLILGLTIHEFCHAKAADKLGDPTPGNTGRLTLNPLAHMDPMGTVCLLFAHFGWGKPVEINPSYFRNPSRDTMLVSLAGPISNLIISFVMFIIFPFAHYFFMPGNNVLNGIMTDMIISAAYINLGLFAFNLLPFPPLDGSKILAHFLKGKARSFIWTLERYSMIIIAILFITDIPSKIIAPIVEYLANYMLGISHGIIWFFMK